MQYPRGSEWRKWDLHVHTPDSLVHHYPGTNAQAWDQFIKELAGLPPEFKVIGINDYIFLDGYKKVRQAWIDGRLPNLDCVLPVIELRIDKFGGTVGHLSRVNFHVIFSNDDDLTPEAIEQQFLNALTHNYQLEPGLNGIDWGGVLTRSSLIDFGNKIIASVPENERGRYNSPLSEGFNNLNLSLVKVREALEQNSFLKGKYLTSVGKTEWAAIKWNDKSIADKKDIINKADLVFIAADTASECLEAREHLHSSNVNSRLLDCSDAHNFTASKDKDRLGHCFTWIKADPTFDGLQMALLEPDDRIFIGDIPKKTKIAKSNPTKYLRKIEINKKPESSLSDIWFDGVQLELNSDLVAIIGNKGSGKSALADIIGLLGDTPNWAKFSFLSPQRFRRSSDDQARHFECKAIWESGSTVPKNLNDSVSELSIETVKYIPQGLFEDICSDIPGGEEDKFDREVKRVIFSRLPVSERLRQSDLDSLIRYKTRETLDAIELLKLDLNEINREMIALEDESSPGHRQRITNLFDLRKRELTAHEALKPKLVSKPDVDDVLNETSKSLNESILDAEHVHSQLAAEIEDDINEREKTTNLISIADKLKQRIENLKSQYDKFRDASEEEASSLGLNIEQIVSLTIDLNPLNKKGDELNQSLQKLNKLLDPFADDDLYTKYHDSEARLQSLHDKLDEPNRAYQAYLNQLEDWQNIRDAIIGSDSKPETLGFYSSGLDRLATVDQRLSDAKNKRYEIVRLIYRRIKALTDEYRRLYEPVQRFIEDQTFAKETLALNFDVAIVDTALQPGLFDFISHTAAGSFRGIAEGERALDEIISRSRLNDESGLIIFLDDLMKSLVMDTRSGSKNRVSDQLKQGKNRESLYEFIFSLDYLRPRYILKMGDKELSQLSPGEKGALLLIFYLLVDKSDMPLVIDQPEENLDNQTVYQLLVKAIKEAKKSRQIILVTHNANLAVVCDAEQVICASIDKLHGNKVEYVSGAIEDPEINRRIVNILEGTKPAFDNRKLKYRG